MNAQKAIMTTTNITTTGNTGAPEQGIFAPRLVVKWQTPTDEALGVARVAGALVERRAAQPAQIVLVAPNRLWALNLKSACDSCKVAASLCIPQPDSARALSHDIQAAPADLKGFSLVRHLGWANNPKMEHALLHLSGSENAEELLAIVHEQLLCPTVPPFATHIPIMLAKDLPTSSLNAHYTFIVGCVKGLICADEDEHTARVQFARLIATGAACTLASYFVKAPLELAQAAHIPFGRQKMEEGKRIAMVQPSPFLEEAGIWRPTTTGGQALLRSCGLN